MLEGAQPEFWDTPADSKRLAQQLYATIWSNTWSETDSERRDDAARIEIMLRNIGDFARRDPSTTERLCRELVPASHLQLCLDSIAHQQSLGYGF